LASAARTKNAPDNIPLRHVDFRVNPFPAQSRRTSSHELRAELASIEGERAAAIMDEIAKLQASPTLTLYGRHGFENNALAKEHGFKWDAEAKQWFRNIKECHYTEGMFPFRVVRDKRER
jgi:hypothetical protein